MSTREARLKKRVEIAEGTLAFHIEKSNGFTFKPGQAVDVILNDPLITDDQNVRPTFSIVSAPFQDELVVATRMRDSPFKRALSSLWIGASVKIDGPFGSLHNDRVRPAVFIAGGIGITPVYEHLASGGTRSACAQDDIDLCQSPAGGRGIPG